VSVVVVVDVIGVVVLVAGFGVVVSTMGFSDLPHAATAAAPSNPITLPWCVMRRSGCRNHVHWKVTKR
jgi:hypothetical protein